VIQLVLPLHECAAEPLQDAAESVSDPAATEAAAVESNANPAGSVAALTKTFCLCVRF
jgi:hypothetical protein